MKKFVAVLVAVAMLLTMAFAVAEESTVSYYQLAAAADAEGNVVSIEALPVFILGIDGASNACCFGTEEETAEGTYEIVAGEDGVYVLYVVLSTGEEVMMFYVAEDDAWMMLDEESGVSMYLFNVEALYAEAA